MAGPKSPDLGGITVLIRYHPLDRGSPRRKLSLNGSRLGLLISGDELLPLGPRQIWKSKATVMTG